MIVIFILSILLIIQGVRLGPFYSDVNQLSGQFYGSALMVAFGVTGLIVSVIKLIA